MFEIEKILWSEARQSLTADCKTRRVLSKVRFQQKDSRFYAGKSLKILKINTFIFAFVVHCT